MGLFSGRAKSDQIGSAGPVTHVALRALGSPSGWALLTGPQTGGEVPELRCDDEELAATLPQALRSAFGTARTSGRRALEEDAAAHPWVRGDWVAATAAGVRLFVVGLGPNGLTVFQLGLTAEPPSYEPSMMQLGRGPTEWLADPELAGWADLIERDDWARLPVWAGVATFLLAGRRSHGMVGGWWSPDGRDPAKAFKPLRAEFVKETVTAFLNGTAGDVDLAGPPGQGFVDPGVTGRWSWRYQWRPFAAGDTFPGAFGVVLGDDGVVRAFHWPDRSTVRRVRVRGQDTWAVKDRSRISGLYRELAGAAELPLDWDVDRVEF